MKTKRIFELKSDRRGLYNKGKKVEAVKKAQPKKKPAPAKDKKK